MRNLTEQEKFWMGSFGDDYIERNSGNDLLAAKLAAFSDFLRHATGIRSTLEFGGNIGMNERAIGLLIPGVRMDVVEINKMASKRCAEIENVTVYNDSIFDFQTDRKYDLVFTCGVMIHLEPDMLGGVYEKMYAFSNRYILINEYYNPEPMEVTYRGNADKLYKRDFAGEMMDMYPNLTLVDYGFIYRRSMSFPVLEDMTWFLMEKH